MKIFGRKASRKAKFNYMFRITNDTQGQFFLQQLRENLNSSSYSLDVKATGPREDTKINTTMSNAKSFRVYLQAKTSKGLKQVDRKKVQI